MKTAPEGRKYNIGYGGYLRKRSWSEIADAYTRQTRSHEKSKSLLRIAIAYVESYVAWRPDHVRPEHIRRFRKWRDANPGRTLNPLRDDRNP